MHPPTRRKLSPSVSNPRGQTAPFFHLLQCLPYHSPRDLPRDPGAHRVSGGSAGAGLAGGRFSLLGDEPPSPGLAAADGGNAEATERGKQPGGARTSRHLLIYRKARPRAPLPEFLILSLSKDDNSQARKRAWQRRNLPSPPRNKKPPELGAPAAVSHESRVEKLTRRGRAGRTAGCRRS